MIAQREKSLFYRALILSAVDEDLDSNPIEEKEKIPYLRKVVYNAEKSLSFKACKSFLGGLGINIPYENREILDNAKKIWHLTIQCKRTLFRRISFHLLR